jgi:hypothetical protein
MWWILKCWESLKKSQIRWMPRCRGVRYAKSSSSFRFFIIVLQIHAFSSMEVEHLDKLNLSYGPFLQIKEQDLKRRSDLSAQAGADKLWSSETLFQHLNMLKDFVPQVSACTHSHGVADLTSSESSWCSHLDRLVLLPSQRDVALR